MRTRIGGYAPGPVAAILAEDRTSDTGTGTNRNAIRSGSTPPARDPRGTASISPWIETREPPSLALAPGSRATSERLSRSVTATVRVRPGLMVSFRGEIFTLVPYRFELSLWRRS